VGVGEHCQFFATACADDQNSRDAWCVFRQEYRRHLMQSVISRNSSWWLVRVPRNEFGDGDGRFGGGLRHHSFILQWALGTAKKACQ